VVGVVGLGYVGLPLAVACAGRYRTRAFDIDPCRIAELRAGRDATAEVDAAALAGATRLSFTAELGELAGCDAFIVTVPTPINAAKQPDLTALESASRQVGRVIAPGNVVIYESTVYPGCTEEVCAPLLEAASGL
jgi:UDP-N-acetyl-D-galactosamine dehydrogenase